MGGMLGYVYINVYGQKYITINIVLPKAMCAAN